MVEAQCRAMGDQRRRREALLAAARAAGVRAFVHTSSVSAYSHLVHETLREDVRQRGAESWINYERSKFAAEAAVRASGIPFVVFQPAHILGPGDTHNWSRLFVLVDQGKLPGVPPGSGSFADVREVRARAGAWLARRPLRRKFPAGRRARQLPRTDHARGRGAGRPTPKRALPPWALRLYARVMVGVAALTAASRRSRRSRRVHRTPPARGFRQGDSRAWLPRNAAAGTARRHAVVDARRRHAKK
jgi:nucleoside-diphosphate-sugar epimerase